MLSNEFLHSWVQYGVQCWVQYRMQGSSQYRVQCWVQYRVQWNMIPWKVMMQRINPFRGHQFKCKIVPWWHGNMPSLSPLPPIKPSPPILHLILLHAPLLLYYCLYFCSYVFCISNYAQVSTSIGGAVQYCTVLYWPYCNSVFLYCAGQFSIL